VPKLWGGQDPKLGLAMANSVHFVLGIVKLTFLLKTSSVPVFFAGMICEETPLSHHFSITVAGVVPAVQIT
jgi:hypothetical protein